MWISVDKVIIWDINYPVILKATRILTIGTKTMDKNIMFIVWINSTKLPSWKDSPVILIFHCQYSDSCHVFRDSRPRSVFSSTPLYVQITLDIVSQAPSTFLPWNCFYSFLTYFLPVVLRSKCSSCPFICVLNIIFSTSARIVALFPPVFNCLLLDHRMVCGTLN